MRDPSGIATLFTPPEELESPGVVSQAVGPVTHCFLIVFIVLTIRLQAVNKPSA
jgi:hypothetical protein